MDVILGFGVFWAGHDSDLSTDRWFLTAFFFKKPKDLCDQYRLEQQTSPTSKRYHTGHKSCLSKLACCTLERDTFRESMFPSMLCN